jgi:hypothetical protein
MVKGAINLDHEMKVAHDFKRSLWLMNIVLTYNDTTTFFVWDTAVRMAMRLRSWPINYCLQHGSQIVRSNTIRLLRFAETIMPHVDKDLMKKVQTMQFFTGSDKKL